MKRLQHSYKIKSSLLNGQNEFYIIKLHLHNEGDDKKTNAWLYQLSADTDISLDNLAALKAADCDDYDRRHQKITQLTLECSISSRLGLRLLPAWAILSSLRWQQIA